MDRSALWKVISRRLYHRINHRVDQIGRGCVPDCQIESRDLPPPVLVIGQQKAGTNLLPELLRNFGLRNAYIHIDNNVSQFYEPNDLESGWLNPRLFDVAMEMTEAVKTVRSAEVATTHVVYSSENEKAFRKFKKIVLKRELRASMISYARMILSTKRGEKALRGAVQERGVVGFMEEKGVKYITQALKVAEWGRINDIKQIAYESAINPNQEFWRSLEEFLYPYGSDDLKSKSQDACSSGDNDFEKKKSITFNKGGVNVEWSEKAEAVFKKIGGEVANQNLGYYASHVVR